MGEFSDKSHPEFVGDMGVLGVSHGDDNSDVGVFDEAVNEAPHVDILVVEGLAD